MNIIHITTIDEGGAYKAVDRIQKSMKTVGISSSILLRNKINRESQGNIFLDSFFKVLVSKVKNGVNLLLKRGTISRELFGSNIVQNREVQNADVIIIHWINSFLSVNTLKKIFETGKKVIIVIHDTWFFTGGCHVNLDCTKYQKGCGFCVYTKQNKKKDITYKNFQDKKNLFAKYNMVVIGPGSDIVSKAQKSPVFEGKKVYWIPNPVDLKLFHPYDNVEILKKKYNVDANKKVILFGAAFNGTQNSEKGFQYLLEALKRLDNRYILVVFGNAEATRLINVKQQYCLLGVVREEKNLAEIYSLSDVYVTPSLQESFGYTILESMACGTPVVAFSNGGSKDLVQHKQNGYLAEYKNSEDLVRGIEYCVNNENNGYLSVNARKNAENYSYENIGMQYKKLLDSLQLE